MPGRTCHQLIAVIELREGPGALEICSHRTQILDSPESLPFNIRVMTRTLRLSGFISNIG